MAEIEIAYRYHGHSGRSDWRYFQAAVREVREAMRPLQQAEHKDYELQPVSGTSELAARSRATRSACLD